jgi:acetyltransferase-like isoleucine patch superfamily enzyme
VTPPITAKGVTILRHARVRLGSNVALGRHLYVETDLTVGDDVLFSGYVAVVGDVHPIDGPSTVFASASLPQQPVVLEGDNLVGYGAILIAPCHLERGAVVGAGAVVTGRLTADSVNVGVPARPIRHRRRVPGQD